MSGVCCAAMLLHAHGFTTPTSALREELDLGRGGSTLPQLAALFQSRGVIAEPVQAPLKQVRRLVISAPGDKHSLQIEVEASGLWKFWRKPRPFAELLATAPQVQSQNP